MIEAALLNAGEKDTPPDRTVMNRSPDHKSNDWQRRPFSTAHP
jgi:hypothetical protein